MLKHKLLMSVAWPTLLVSLLLFGMCLVAAAYLYLQQRTTAELLGENVESRRAAHDLDTTLDNLATLLRGGSDQVEALHERIQDLLANIQRLSDKPEEHRFLHELEADYKSYRALWEARGDRLTGGHTGLIQAVLTMRATCQALRDFNAQQIEQSEAVHSETVRWMAWGLASVGCVGAIAGIVLGYGMSRALQRSIHQLSIRVRDARDRIRQDLPSVILVEDGDLTGLHQRMQGLVQDIEKMVQQLQEREHEVLRAEHLAAVGQLAAGVAHELRNPLTAIKMLLQTLREEVQERGQAPEDIQIIEQEVRRMERCLQTFLDFARPSRPQRQLLKVADVVTHTLTLLDGRAGNQRVRLTARPSGAATWVEADPDQLHQLLVNLMLNALDATPAGGTIEVAWQRTAERVVEIQVRDTGAGIPADVLPHLFEPFVSSKETGLGLGLVVSRRIAEDHGGDLRGENQPEGGACFVLRLPEASRSIGQETIDHAGFARC